MKKYIAIVRDGFTTEWEYVDSQEEAREWVRQHDVGGETEEVTELNYTLYATADLPDGWDVYAHDHEEYDDLVPVEDGTIEIAPTNQ